MGVSHEAPIIRVLAFLCSALVVVMIRLRIERPCSSPSRGLIWYADGRPIGDAILEQWVEDPEALSGSWIPVQVVEDRVEGD